MNCFGSTKCLLENGVVASIQHHLLTFMENNKDIGEERERGRGISIKIKVLWEITVKIFRLDHFQVNTRVFTVQFCNN